MPSFTPRRATVVAAGALASVLIAGPAAHAAEPQLVADNPTCAQMQGKESWQQLKIDPVPAGVKAFAAGGLSGTINVDAARLYFDFAALPGVDAVIVKGGPNANVYRYTPDATAAKNLHAPINPKTKKPYGLSHISFCWGPDQPGGGGGSGTPGTTAGGTPSTGGTTPTTGGGGTPAAQPPHVLGDKIGPGRARLTGVTGCAKNAFTARVRGQHIKSVVFKIDGRRVKTVRSASAKATKASLRVDPARYGRGTHRLTARVTFNPGSRTRSRTLALAFQRCARAAVAPKFAG